RRTMILDSIDAAQFASLEPDTTDQQREDAVNEALDKLIGKSAVLSERESVVDDAPVPEPTKSWMNRPSSRGGDAISRSESPAQGSDHEFRRSQIARNLGAKDASFFKQTSDRKIAPE